MSDSDAVDDFDSDDMEELVAADFSEDEDAVERETRCSGRTMRARKHVDYTREKKDPFFDGYSGISHFGRTRKGGDVRPRAKQVMLSVMFVYIDILYRYIY